MKKQIFFYMLFFSIIITNILLYTKLPAYIPTHWNVEGTIDAYMPKLFIFFPAAILLLMKGLFIVLKHIDPKKDNYCRFVHAYEAFQLALYLFIFCLWGISVVACFDSDMINMSMIMNLLIGAVFTIFGNLMPKLKSNYFIGIKTPWTLSNETVWMKTHRMAGKLWFFGGILMIVCALLMKNHTMIVGQFVVMVCMLAFVPCIYSYVLYRKITQSV